MFRIKICGVTTPDDARVIVDAGADAIGLNFYPRSKRCTDAKTATQIAKVTGDAKLVGVFVNASAEEINTLAVQVPLDAIQLHGDEPPEFLRDLQPGLPVILARPMPPELGLRGVAEWLDAAESVARPCAAALVDAAVPGQYGGTGKTADWGRVAQQRGLLGDTPLLLAGGLTPENVAAAIQTAKPHGVDTASGVESAPGVKDAGQVARFVSASRAALGIASSRR